MTVHESVAVGAFCYAAGAVFMHYCHEAKSKGWAKGPDMAVLNFSHNPLDPAVGDLVFENNGDDQQFYIIELKRDWASVGKEITKRLEHDRPVFELADLADEFPNVESAHLIGWMRPTSATIACQQRPVSELVFASYWGTLSVSGKDDVKADWLALKWLSHVCKLGEEDKKPKGFFLDELAAYIKHINFGAGGKTATGAESFVMTFRDYRAFAAHEQHILRLLPQHEVEANSRPRPYTDQCTPFG